jgi:2-oxoglutarate ferredoxin oxidoreductase subunit gamma
VERTPDSARIRLTGRGGQGVMLAGAILAEAAMRDGRHVAQTQEYGPEARLGATRADVVIAEWEIAYPEVDRADLLLCLSRDGALRYVKSLAAGGTAVVDSRFAADVGVGDAGRIVALPLQATARAVGDEITTNVVGLGALVGISGAVTEESLAAALAARTKPEFAELNRRALEAGLALGRA